MALAAAIHSLPAQHEPFPHAANPAQQAPVAQPTRTTPPCPAEQKRGTKDAPSHAPLPVLRPLVAWQHIRAGNAALLAARAAGTPTPAPPDRPAGAGRYVCAVLVCADADIDIPAVFGLQRRDVLLISTPGPFVHAEAVALLERVVREERLSLVLILAHPQCTTLDVRPGISPRQDALARRLETVRAEAQRNQTPLGKALVLLQREHLLAASDELRQRVTADELRVMPGEVDARTGALVWHLHRTDELPLQPVK